MVTKITRTTMSRKAELLETVAQKAGGRNKKSIDKFGRKQISRNFHIQGRDREKKNTGWKKRGEQNEEDRGRKRVREELYQQAKSRNQYDKANTLKFQQTSR